MNAREHRHISTRSVRVWGLHTRLFHLLLMSAVSFSLVSALWEDLDLMEWHFISGYVVLGLLVFKLLAGIWGRDYGRFAAFSLSVRSIKAYLQGRDQYLGHNPLGSWMVLVMLLCIVLQVLSGFFTTDDIFYEGPWVAFASDQWISWAGSIHNRNFWLLLGLIALHIAAIIYYWRIKNTDLITPMISGRKQVLADDEQPAAQATGLARIIPMIACAIGLVWLAVTFS